MKMLEKARGMSNGDKNKLSLILSASLTAVIVLVWFLALRAPKVDVVSEENSTAQSLKPLFMIFKGAKDEISEIKSEAQDYKKKSDEVKAKTVTQ